MAFERSEAFLNKKIDPMMFARLDGNGQSLLERQEKYLEELAGGITTRVLSIDPRSMMKRYLNDLRLKISAEVMLRLTQEDNFEIWSFDLKLLGTGNKLLKRLSYSIEDLLSNDWNDLFDRDLDAQKQILNAIDRLKAGERIINDVAPHHFVTESQANRRSAMVEVKTLAFAFDIASEKPAAIVAITNIQD